MNTDDIKMPDKIESSEESHETDDHIVCFCHNVKALEITLACKKGKLSLSELQAETKASTGCGGCEWEVKEILQTALSKIENLS